VRVSEHIGVNTGEWMQAQRREKGVYFGCFIAETNADDLLFLKISVSG
jgi:hypothetical protein